MQPSNLRHEQVIAQLPHRRRPVHGGADTA